MIIPTLIAALVVSYVFHYRKMKDRTVIAKLFLQVLVTFLSIHYLIDFLLRDLRELDSDKTNPMSLLNIDDETDPAAASDGPPTQPNAWYYSKKVWGCILFAGLAAVVYYLSGFAPSSPDDMKTFRNLVSQGIENVNSEQVSLSQTVAERVNSAAFRADMLNSTSEVMLSDIIAAGDAARVQLEQMGRLGGDFNQLDGRVDRINDRMTVLLKGIVYLISLRWAFFRNHSESAAPPVGSNVVNEVMSSERPFSFGSVITGATIAQNVITEATTTVATMATQTDDTDSDRILSIVNPVVEKHGKVTIRFPAVQTIRLGASVPAKLEPTIARFDLHKKKKGL